MIYAVTTVSSYQASIAGEVGVTPRPSFPVVFYMHPLVSDTTYKLGGMVHWE